MKLIVALGNPGATYAATRHNIAWQLLEHLSFFHRLSWQTKFKGEFAGYFVNKNKVFFLKPQTYMNRSGESVQAMANFFKIDIGEILVLHDDIELEFGVVGFKIDGGLAGHNGLRSIASKTGSRDFNRMRLGISRPDHGQVEAFVLSRFSADEQAMLPVYLDRAAWLFEQSLSADFSKFAAKHRKEALLS